MYILRMRYHFNPNRGYVNSMLLIICHLINRMPMQFEFMHVTPFKRHVHFIISCSIIVRVT